MTEDTDTQDAAKPAKRKRTVKPIPSGSFEEALGFAKSILAYGSGTPVRRLGLFDHIGKAPESGPSRGLIATASKYGLISGSAKSEHLELTKDGLKAADEEVAPKLRVKARFDLSIASIDSFNHLYEQFKNNRLPAKQALVDSVKDSGLDEEYAEECVDTFIVNARYLKILKTLSGAERIVTIEHALDDLPTSQQAGALNAGSTDGFNVARSNSLVTSDQADFETTCFYITPIGEEDSEERKHSDLFLGSIVEPALEKFQLKVVRADQIAKPGTITRQVIDFLLRSRLVIADMSYHNPNVFYELAIRHAARLPVVQLIRSSDRIPFDLGQVRTIQIDTSTIYSLVPQIEVHRSEISAQVRAALEDPDSVDNPISLFYPNFRTVLDTEP